MSNPYVGEIRMFAGNFAPVGWEFCAGQLLPISDYGELFNLIGTTYGGDGVKTFALPSLQSRFPMHQGNSFVLGQQGGVEQVTLTVSEIPAHNHPAACATGRGNSASPVGNYWSRDPAGHSAAYDTRDGSAMAAEAIGSAGGSAPHDNMSPFLGINFIISLFGVFPSQG